MPLFTHAGGHSSHLEALTTLLRKWITKINSNPDLSPSEKVEARRKAEKSIQKDKRKSLKNCY